VEAPDILNSKVKKVRIELPFFSFSHSSSGDSLQPFLGRERIREKLIKIVEDSPDESGVYLIAGNRGVGKTSLVSEVIKETSLVEDTTFAKNLKYLFSLLLFVALIQISLHRFLEFNWKLWAFWKIWPILSFFSLIALGAFSGYRHEIPKRKKIVLKKGLWNRVIYFSNIIAAIMYEFLFSIIDSFISVIIELLRLIDPLDPNARVQNVFKFIFVICSMISLNYLCIGLGRTEKDCHIISMITLFSYLGIVVLWICIRFIIRKFQEKKNKSILVVKGLFNLIKKYIKNHRRLYLRINFGHKLNDEKDILRLITRTLNNEYQRYHRSWKRKLPYRIVIFGILFIFTSLFCNFVRENDIYKSICEPIWNNTITQILSNDAINILKNERIFGDIKSGILNISDKLFFVFVFFFIYLLCVLLFSCTWIMNFFVTHRVIMRRLKRLNSDITYSTVRENSISLESIKKGFIPNIETSIRRSRNVADAREIEKELQDILIDMQRIPVIMCRPKIVVVFDELDKVESGDTDAKRVNSQTKASLFSINATRERQTEILRILSNMKYFLSTARAKFIFIAGREMFDIHLADVSERNNYIGSIFNAVIYVPSFLTDHHTGKNALLQESSIASLPEEFVCRKLIPHNYYVESYNLKNYRKYLRKNKLCKGTKGFDDNRQSEEEKIQKVIAVLQQFIIYLAHVSKGAPKKMMQIFDSFVDINIKDRENKENALFVRKYSSSRHFLSFNYYRQYTLGIVAYLVTPIFYRLSESNIKEHSDKLLVSALRVVDFLFKFHKDSFSWKHLNMSPEMLESNHAPELKSVVVDLVNYLAKVHINKSTFSLSEYKFDGLIANEIFAMAKTDEVFSALFSFSLDETLPLREHYQVLLEETKKDYKNEHKAVEYIDSISSLEVVLGDLHYYADELEEAEAYYKNSVQELRKIKLGDDDKNVKERDIMAMEKFYLYVRNMLRLGMIYEKRKQYDFAYQIYFELCSRIIFERKNPYNILKTIFEKINIKVNDDSILTQKMTYEGLKILYLPFIAKFQIIEKCHVGGIAKNDLEQLNKEINCIVDELNYEGANILKAEYYSRVADVLYYKNSDLEDNSVLNKEDKSNKNDKNETKLHENCSCTVCSYYQKALSILLNLENSKENTIKKLLVISVELLKDNYDMKFCTTLARILSDWGNVFFSCDKINDNRNEKCYICDCSECNSKLLNYGCENSEIVNNYEISRLINFKEELNNYINKENSITRKEICEIILINFIKKMEIAFTMYSISSEAYCKSNLYKRSSFQIYKILCLIKDYELYKDVNSKKYINELSKKAIHYLWYANEDLNVHELNKRKADFKKKKIKSNIPLQYLLVDTEITRIKILVQEIKLKTNKEIKNIKKYYNKRITSPYEINYSIVARIYRLRLKAKVNYETYQLILEKAKIKERKNIDYNLNENDYYKIIYNNYCKTKIVLKYIFNNYININEDNDIIVKVLENLIAESIYCLIDISQLTETMDENYLFPHSYLGSVHEHLSFWIRQYEEYEKYKSKNSQINVYLRQYLDEEWRVQLSGYRENQLAISHYYKCLEMHRSGRSYHNMIDTMCYVKDDFNDRSDHFNIAEERHLILSNKIERKIEMLKDIYKDSKLYKVGNYLAKRILSESENCNNIIR
jgi:hypothetical protein